MHIIARVLTMFLLVSGLVAVGATAASGQVDLDCIDFATQAEAQAEFDADPSDPHGLDADGDGIACEWNPDGGGAGGTQPFGAVDTGGAGTQGLEDKLLFLFGGVALATAGALFVRRRQYD